MIDGKIHSSFRDEYLHLLIRERVARVSRKKYHFGIHPIMSSLSYKANKFMNFVVKHLTKGK